MRGNAKNKRERLWRERLAGWKNSGRSQAAYCRQLGLSANDFSWWKREILRRDALATPAFVPLSIVSAPAMLAYAFELGLRGGRVLRFDHQVDPGVLSRVVRVLERGGNPPC